MSEAQPDRITKKVYNKQTNEPRWQYRRVRIYDRDKWHCRFCFATSITLNVHHTEYADGADLWDYPDEALVTLCEDCHWIMQHCSKLRPRTFHCMAMLLRALNQYACTLNDEAPPPTRLLEEIQSVPSCWKNPHVPEA